MPSACSRCATPACSSTSTVPGSSTPARMRPNTYSGLRRSSSRLSMPARCSSWPSSNPAGPAPTMTTWVLTGNSIPDFAGRFDHQRKFRALLVDGERVALLGRRESALRTEAQLLERHEARRLVDTALERVLALELTALGGHHAQDHVLVLQHDPQRLEPSGARVLIL